jgi:bifunctional DNA primase/polymerase-like protein
MQPVPGFKNTPRHRELPERGAFATNFADAHAAGLAYLPTAVNDCKKPIVSNWTRWKGQPRLSTCARWAERMPDANGAYLPSASGLIVVDIDDRKDEDRACERLGLNGGPLVESGKRGVHFVGRTNQPVPTIDLRPFGITGEIRGVRSIVVAPGSRHPETGKLYRFLGGASWETFAEAPTFNLAALENLIDRPLDMIEEPRTPVARNPEGSRNTPGTFAHLRALGAQGVFSSLDDVLDAGRSYNSQFNEPPEPDHKVVGTCKSVWRYVQEDRCRAPKRITYSAPTDAEFAALRSLGPEHDYADALALFVELKRAHGLRSGRGETFAIAATPMAAAKRNAPVIQHTVEDVRVEHEAVLGHARSFAAYRLGHRGVQRDTSGTQIGLI